MDQDDGGTATGARKMQHGAMDTGGTETQATITSPGGEARRNRTGNGITRSGNRYTQRRDAE